MQRIKKAYAENGDLKIIPDTPPLDGSENWEQGRGAYYELDNDPNTGDPLALDIDREQDNYFKNVISNNIKHWQENSYPIWFDDIEYPKNATVKYTDGNTYVSKVDNNTALPTDTNNWVNFEDFGSLNINTLPDKPTPDDTDNLALQEVGGDLKKVSFLNIQNVLQVVYAENKVLGSGGLIIPADGTIPQITEGNEILTCTITPKKANSRLLIEFTPSCQEVSNTGDIITVACFRNGVTNALYQIASAVTSAVSLTDNSLTGRFIINTPSTNALTFSLRAGLGIGAIQWNQINYSTRLMTTFTTMTITEIL